MAAAARLRLEGRSRKVVIRVSVYKDQQRNTWYCKVRYKDWMGDTKMTTKRGFRTKKDAEQWEREFLVLKAGEPEMSFRQFVGEYKDDRAPRLRLSTQAMKDYIIDTKLLPYFGEKKMNEISPRDVLKWQNVLLSHRDEESGKPYSPVYLKTLHNQLSAIFNHACRFYELKKNPARTAGNMGADHGREMEIWTPEEYLCFSEGLMDTPVAYYCFEVLYWCGIREGELLALTQNDFDFRKRELSITKTYHRQNHEDVITAPKTPKGKRVISMPEFLCEELQDYFRLCCTQAHDERAFPVSKNFLQRKMQSVSERQGVRRIRIHDIRHSHVSLLINMGFDAVAIAERLGHESIDITFRYAHLFPEVQGEMAKRLDQVRGEQCVGA